MKAWSLVAAAFLAAACCVGLALAGEIRGQLSVPVTSSRPPRPHAYPGRANSLPLPAQVQTGAVWDAVVYVDRVPPTAVVPSGGARPRLEQKAQSFVPRVLAVVAGTVVDFPNLDAVFHNVFSVSPAKRFDLGKYSRGQSRSVTFSKTGLVKVYCDIHSDMAAFIYVLPHAFFAQPDDAGFFALPDLPAGHYRLRVWHPDFGDIERQVEVPDSTAVSVDLTY
jgi:plastocyanin